MATHMNLYIFEVLRMKRFHQLTVCVGRTEKKK